MQIFKPGTNFDFLRWGDASMVGSGLVILAGLIAYFVANLNYGIDFTGGTLVQVRLGQAQDINEVRQILADGGTSSFELQALGESGAHEYLITLGGAAQEPGKAGETPAAKVEQVLKEHFPSLEVRRVESVGPKVGAELKTAAFEAVLFALAAILIYVWLRFEWRYSVGAVVALFHDVLIVLAAFVVTQREISLPVVAAVLTVAGYSINDTIVIFDRIRENVRKFQKKPLLELYNESINQTLNRTVLTSGTTLLVILSIFILGGSIINDFAFALLIGILVGTYSSVYIAAALTLKLQLRFPRKVA